MVGCSDDSTGSVTSGAAIEVTSAVATDVTTAGETEVSAAAEAGGLTMSEFPSIPTSSWVVAISCPASSECFAADYDGVVFTLNGGTWSVADAPPLHNLSCATPTMCLGTAPDGDGGAENAFAWDGDQWAMVPGGLSQVIEVTCASDQTCMLLESSGEVSLFSDGELTPGGDMAMSRDRIASLSCSSASSCVAIGYDTGATSRFDGSVWTESAIDVGVSSGQVSCSADSACSVVTYEGGFFQLESDGWRDLGPIGSDKFESLSCQSATECVVATGEGSENPGKVTIVHIAGS